MLIKRAVKHGGGVF